MPVRWTRRTVLAAAAAALATLGLWSSREGKATIPDPAQAASISLATRQRTATSLRLRVVGELDGTATIKTSEPVGDSILEKDIGPGRVDVTLSGDFFVRRCVLSYAPKDVRSGRLEIRYRFGSLDSVSLLLGLASLALVLSVIAAFRRLLNRKVGDSPQSH